MTDQPTRLLGRWMSLAMVVGTMIGSGVYLLPTTLAPFGANMLVAFAVTIGGTLCLALALALLSARIPGGPFAYVSQAFGETTAFVTLWSYAVSQWTGVAAIAIAVAGALSYIVPALGRGAPLIMVALAVIAALLAINLRGVRAAGGLQVAATMIKIVPLLAVVLLVAGRLVAATPTEPLAAVPLTLAAIAGAGALMLFSLTGFEAAAVVATITDNAETNVPMATLVGTALTGAIYLTATVATLMLLSSARAATSGAPFADAIAPILGHAAGALVAAIAAVSAFGTANALLMLGAEVSRTLARADHLPRLLRRTNARGAPSGALAVSAAIAALLVVASSSDSFVAVYVFITLVSTVAALILYVVCAAAALKLRIGGRWSALMVVALGYGLVMFIGAGLEPTLWGFGLAAAGLPVRWLSRRFNVRFNRRETSPAAAPAQAAPGE